MSFVLEHETVTFAWIDNASVQFPLDIYATKGFRHQKFPGSLILSGHDGDDAKHYQEKQVRNAIREASK